jgi:hypothetical protein
MKTLLDILKELRDRELRKLEAAQCEVAKLTASYTSSNAAYDAAVDYFKAQEREAVRESK